ncbi:hypothetical protein TIFTF001_018508 [Ficus carica]|uniref:DUF2828 domain-containing protein n=1 Tax=Ficus carica TaxID=3494 RepID=A0AA88A9V9_FICCA|nr:hypothetical protein TIFTF001_018508 [Ficus carica]
MDLIVANYNSTTLPGRLPRGSTVGQSSTFLSSSNPCLDFFFQIVPNTTPSESVAEKLTNAWAHNPLTALKLICNLRGVSDTGKSDREGFFTAAIWLHDHHPESLALNVGVFAEFGSFQDLPEILYRLLEGPDVRKIQKEERLSRKGRGRSGIRWFRRGGGGVRKKKRVESSVMREIRIARAEERSKREKEEAKVLREEKIVAMAKKLIDRYGND